jgi:hypothetical protein
MEVNYNAVSPEADFDFGDDNGLMARADDANRDIDSITLELVLDAMKVDRPKGVIRALMDGAPRRSYSEALCYLFDKKMNGK